MLVCPRCQTQNAPTASFCESCGNSLASLREGDDAIADMLLKQTRRGVWALGIVAVMQGITTLVVDPGNWLLWGFTAVFAALALWAMRAPLVAAALGLGIFVLLHLADAFIDPTSIHKGIIMKVVIVSLLIGAMKSALQHRNFQRERGL